MREITYTETGVRGRSYIQVDEVKAGIESPVLLVAMIKPHNVKRDMTPQCLSGFPCSDGFSNPFEYGHVMGWELGGPNETSNIVPMYGRWQANVTAKGKTGESWRDMEVSIRSLAGKANQYIYIAVLKYDDPTDEYTRQSDDFKNWKQMFAWQDYRIPTSLHIRVELASSTFGKQLVAQFLSTTGLGTGHAALATNLLGGVYGGTPAYEKSWDQTAIPSQDLDFLLRNIALTATEESFRMHEEEKELQFTQDRVDLKTLDLGGSALNDDELDEWSMMPQSPRRDDETATYINEHSSKIHNLMVSKYQCSSSLAKTMTPALLLAANKFKVRNVKQWTKNWELKKEERRERIKKLVKDKRFLKFQTNRGIYQPK